MTLISLGRDRTGLFGDFWPLNQWGTVGAPAQGGLDAVVVDCAGMWNRQSA